MARAAQVLAARTAAAAEARVKSIDTARSHAAMAAKADEDIEKMQREFHKQRLAREKEAAVARTSRERNVSFEQSRRRAAAEHAARVVEHADEEREKRERQQFEQQLKDRIREERRRATANAARDDDETAHNSEEAAGGVASTASPGKKESPAKPRGPAEFAETSRRAEEEARAEERFRAFERDAARRQQAPFGKRSLPQAGLPRGGGVYGRAGAGASMLRGRAVEAALLHCNDVDAKPTDALIAHALRHQGCPHRCLGVAPNCQAAAVRKRFLSLARRLHPDKTDHPSAAQAFAAIEAAFRDMQ